MAAVQIRVGAAAEASLKGVFREAVETSKRAQRQIEADAKSAARRRLAEAEKTGKAEARAYDQVSTAAVRARDRQMAADRKSFDERLKLSAKGRAAEERDILAVARKAESAASRQMARDSRQRGRARVDMAKDAAGTFGGLARGAGRFAGQVARGMGVDFDVTSQISGALGVQKRVAGLVNAAYMPGEEGAQGTLQSRSGVMSDVKGTADKYGYSREETAGGLQSFVATSGNLELGRKVLPELAKLARATETELSDMMAAAAEVAPQLENSVDPAKDLLAVMTGVAGMGKVGAIEVKDLTKYFASFAASGPQFEGDVAKNIQTMAMLGQLAKKFGGARNPAEAATAAMSFTTTLKKGARRKEFAAADISLEGAGGMMRDPLDVLKDVVFKTGGKVDEMNKLVMDARAQKFSEGLGNIYRQGGGGASGEKAVNDEIAKMKRAALDVTEVNRAVADRMGDTDVKAQQFNNRLQDIAESLATRLLPVMERAAPSILKLTTAFADAATWAAENPGKLLVAALVLSIGKAAIGGAIEAAILKRAMGGGAAAAGAPGAAAAGGMSLAAKALTIAATAVVIEQVGELVIDKIMKGREDDAAAKDAASFEALNTEMLLRSANGGNASPEMLSALSGAGNELRQKIGAAEQTQGGGFWQSAARLVTGDGGGLGGLNREREDAKNITALEAKLAEINATMAAVQAKLGGNLSVTVTNPTPGAAPGADPAGRGGSGMPVPAPRGPGK